MAHFKQNKIKNNKKFSVGDVVDYHPSLTNHKTIFAGVIIDAGIKTSKVLISNNELYLRIATAEIGQQRQAHDVSNLHTEYGQILELQNHCLIDAKINNKTNVSKWFELPSMEEIDKIRYEVLSEGLFDDNDVLGS